MRTSKQGRRSFSRTAKPFTRSTSLAGCAPIFDMNYTISEIIMNGSKLVKSVTLRSATMATVPARRIQTPGVKVRPGSYGMSMFGRNGYTFEKLILPETGPVAQQFYVKRPTLSGQAETFLCVVHHLLCRRFGRGDAGIPHAHPQAENHRAVLALGVSRRGGGRDRVLEPRPAPPKPTLVIAKSQDGILQCGHIKSTPRLRRRH